MKLLSKIKRVRYVIHDNEANELLKNGWILLSVCGGMILLGTTTS